MIFVERKSASLRRGNGTPESIVVPNRNHGTNYKPKEVKKRSTKIEKDREALQTNRLSERVGPNHALDLRRTFSRRAYRRPTWVQLFPHHRQLACIQRRRRLWTPARHNPKFTAPLFGAKKQKAGLLPTWNRIRRHRRWPWSHTAAKDWSSGACEISECESLIPGNEKQKKGRKDCQGSWHQGSDQHLLAETTER